MKSVGLIGGIALPSTIDYYTRIVDGYRALTGDQPSVIINSISLSRLLTLAGEKKFDELTDMLVFEIQRLIAAGVDFVAMSSNTPHIVYEQVAARSSKPILSIVSATLDEAQKLGARSALLFGTRFTMEGGFYQRGGIRVEVPDEESRTFIHDSYMNELIRNQFKPETRERMLSIARASSADVLILGGTELPLLLRDGDAGKPMLDTTEIHVKRIVEELL